MSAPPPDPPVFLKQRHIKLLLALDQCRHLGKAANALHMSQPAASKSLALLESQVGHTLFDRSGTGTEPTALGRIMIDYAKNLSGAARRISAEVDALVNRDRQLLRIGILPSASIHITPKLITALLDKSPELDITILEGLLHDLLDMLSNNHLDCVIGRTTSRIDSRQIEGLFLYEDPISLVCGANSDLARQPNVSPAELAGFMWILPIKDSILSDRMDEMFARLAVPRPLKHIESNALLTNVILVNQHPWITALPSVIAQYFEELRSVKILPIDTKINFGNIQVMTRKQSTMAPPLALAIETLRELFH
jgi:DNA-binding transcriptional LysR family regulator